MTETEDLSENGWTKRQWIALLCTARFSSSLSLLGSLTIIFMILRRRKIRLALIHNRLLLGVSTLDIIASISLEVGTAAVVPSYTSYVYGASGTDVSCKTQGFLCMLLLGIPVYNASLCIYYLAVIKYDVKEHILQKYEKYMHGIPIFIALSLAVSALWLDLYQSTNYLVICWIPDGIRDVPMKLFIWKVITLVIIQLSFVVIFFTMAGVYYTVRQQSNVMQQYQNNYFPRASVVESTNTAVGMNRNRTNTESQQQANNHSNDKAKRETATQAFLYLAAFLLTFSFSTINSFTSGGHSFFIAFMTTLLFPLQVR